MLRKPSLPKPQKSPTLPVSQVQQAAMVAKAAAMRAGKKAKAEARALAVAAPPLGTWEHEVKRWGPELSVWRSRIRRERGFDPCGFFENLLNGKYEVNAESMSGEGAIGIGVYKPRPHQIEWCRAIIEHRWAATDDARWSKLVADNPALKRPEGRFGTLVVKSRRMGFSTNHVQILHGDGDANRGCNSVISAHTSDGLDNMFEILSTSFGGSKSVDVEDEDGNVTKVKKSKGLARRRFQTMSDSIMRLLGPNDSMGRGWNPMHLMWTEVDYLDDIDGPLDSVLPSVNKSAFATVTLESTMRQDASTGFKDFVYRTLRGETSYHVYFQGWMDDVTAVLRPTDEELRAINARESLDGANGYEFVTLIDQCHASVEQVAWWRRRFREDARNNLDKMREMYPTTRDEALTAAVGVEFLDTDAMDYLEGCCAEPVERRQCRYDSLEEIHDANVWLSQPHLAIWEPPAGGRRYVIGCDGADAAMRQEFEVGSECYFVVLDESCGEQVAEWHGFANSPDFAIAIWKAATFYNTAMVIPEKNACSAAIAYLTDTLQYSRVYERETFAAVVQTFAGLYGFDTKGASRAILVQRLQDNVNRRTMVLKSRYLVDQLRNFGRRRGRPNKQPKRKGTDCDDGPIALGLCMFGHDNAINGAWQPKDAIDLASAPRTRIDNTERAKSVRGELEAWNEEDRFIEADHFLNRT